MFLFLFQDELEAIKIRLEKSEHDRLKLKHENDKLESKVSHDHRIMFQNKYNVFITAVPKKLL